MAEEFSATAQGSSAESLACAFLQNQGLVLLQKNFSCPCGELDLVMQDRDEVVFVEVRLRRYSYLGSPIETVNSAKQSKLIKTALLYLQKKRWLDRVNTRFDIIGVDAAKKIEWIKNAFGLGFV